MNIKNVQLKNFIDPLNCDIW